MSNSIKEMAEQAVDPTLLLTPKINEFILSGDTFTEEAMNTVWEQLTKPGRNRSGSYSASSAGTCLRKQELQLLGAPQKPIMPALAEIFKVGHWEHARTQARMLSAGVIHSIEVPLPWPKMNSVGTMDGQGSVTWTPANPEWADKEFGLEIKTMNSFVYDKVVASGKPKDEHLAQMSRYALHAGLDMFVYWLIPKGANEPWHEIVVDITPEMKEESLKELKALKKAYDDKKLHDILPGCKIGTTTEYKQCPFTGKAGPCKANKDVSWPDFLG